MPQIPKPVILQRDRKTYAIRPRTPMGMVTAEVLESIAAAIRKYDIPFAKITAGQRFMLSGVQLEDLDALRDDLGPLGQVCGYYVQACPGTAVCRLGLGNSLEIGSRIDEMMLGMPLPAKVKVGVSGCPLCCGESYVRDVGLLARKEGWTVIIGGSSSGRPRIGDILAQSLDADQAVELVENFLAHYRENAKKSVRVARFVNRVGIDAVMAALHLDRA